MALTGEQKKNFEHGYTGTNEQLTLIKITTSTFKASYNRVKPLGYATFLSVTSGIISSLLPITLFPFANIALLLAGGAFGIKLYEQTSPSYAGHYGEQLEDMLFLFHACFQNDTSPDYQKPIVQDFILSITPLLSSSSKTLIKHSTTENQSYFEQAEQALTATSISAVYALGNMITLGIGTKKLPTDSQRNMSPDDFQRALQQALSSKSHTDLLARTLFGEQNPARLASPYIDKASALLPAARASISGLMTKPT